MSTVPPSGASTRAAALASLSANSTVMGCSPTLPRTPSVPKNLRPIELFSLERRRRDAHRVERGGHVVGAHDTRSVENRNGGQCDAARSSIIDRAAGELRQHGLARQPHGDRCAETIQPSEMFEQCQVVSRGLAEAETGIYHDARAVDAGFPASGDA